MQPQGSLLHYQGCLQLVKLRKNLGVTSILGDENERANGDSLKNNCKILASCLHELLYVCFKVLYFRL